MAETATTATAPTGGSSTQTTDYLYPSTWTNLTDTGANYASGFPEWANQTYENWYSNPLTTGVTPTLQNAYTNMATPQTQWISGIQNAQQVAGQSQPYMGQAADLYAGGATYDPNEMQQFLNPYINDAANATMNQVNRNLMENIVPNLNSTFSGTGQFGSTRNADFMNRAIRDTQQGLADTLAKQNVANYQTAQQNALNWAQQGNASAQGLANLGANQLNYASTLGNLAGAGANLTQQNLTNALTAGTSEQQLQQATLDKAYQDWLTQQQFPTQQLGALGQYVGNAAKGTQPNVNQAVSSQAAPTDDVTKILAAIQAASSGLSDASIQGILTELGLGTLFG